MYLSIYLYLTLTSFAPRAEIWRCLVTSHVTLATWASYVSSLPAVRLCQRNTQKYFGNLIRDYFSGLFPICTLKRFRLPTRYTIQLRCLACFETNHLTLWSSESWGLTTDHLTLWSSEVVCEDWQPTI